MDHSRNKNFTFPVLSFLAAYHTDNLLGEQISIIFKVYVGDSSHGTLAFSVAPLVSLAGRSISWSQMNEEWPVQGLTIQENKKNELIL